MGKQALACLTNNETCHTLNIYSVNFAQKKTSFKKCNICTVSLNIFVFIKHLAVHVISHIFHLKISINIMMMYSYCARPIGTRLVHNGMEDLAFIKCKSDFVKPILVIFLMVLQARHFIQVVRQYRSKAWTCRRWPRVPSRLSMFEYV